MSERIDEYMSGWVGKFPSVRLPPCPCPVNPPSWVPTPTTEHWARPPNLLSIYLVPGSVKGSRLGAGVGDPVQEQWRWECRDQEAGVTDCQSRGRDPRVGVGAGQTAPLPRGSLGLLGLCLVAALAGDWGGRGIVGAVLESGPGPWLWPGARGQGPSLGLAMGLGWSGRRQQPHSVRGPQRVPLGNGPPGVGQHVCPVPQASPASRRPHGHPPNGLVLAQLVVVQHSQLHLHLLGWGEGRGDRAWEGGTGGARLP